MDSVLRAFVIYMFLLLIFRVAEKRSLAQITTFDFLLLLVIGEATQQGLLGNDFSVTNAFLVIVTLLGLDIAMSLLKRVSKRAEKWLDDVSLVIVEDGRPLTDRMDKARVDQEDVLAAARQLQGLERWSRSNTRSSNAVGASPSSLRPAAERFDRHRGAGCASCRRCGVVVALRR